MIQTILETPRAMEYFEWVIHIQHNFQLLCNSLENVASAYLVPPLSLSLSRTL